MNPYNADTDPHLYVAWEEGFLAATEAVLEVAKEAAGYDAVEVAVHLATQKNDAWEAA